MIINVTQYNNFIKAIIDNEPILSKVTVCGEVSNLRYTSESIFFSLKDAFCQMDCFMYLNQLEKPIRNGQEVMVNGTSNYLKSGKISFFVTKIVLKDNIGEQFKKILDLKDKLQKLGYFDQKSKKTLPKYIFNIGVVTSQNGAVIHDISEVVSRRNKYAKIFLYDVKVQGEDASIQIANAIEYFNSQPVDCVIIARGGGSKEDLSAFDTEVVALAVKESIKPIISAVGHETDISICDYCADIRAGTPSIAAEIVTNFNIDQDLSFAQERLKQAFNKLLFNKREKFNNAFVKLNNFFDTKIKMAKSFLAIQNERSLVYLENLLEKKINEQSFYHKKLELLSPQNALKSNNIFIVKNGEKVFSLKNLSKGDKITIHFLDGKLNATINEVENEF